MKPPIHPYTIEMDPKDLQDAFDAGYEYASKLKSEGKLREDHAYSIDCTFAECQDPRVEPWIEGMPGFWLIFAEFAYGFKGYLRDYRFPYMDLINVQAIADNEPRS